jgi:hypothetical protein
MRRMSFPMAEFKWCLIEARENIELPVAIKIDYKIY